MHLCPHACLCSHACIYIYIYIYIYICTLADSAKSLLAIVHRPTCSCARACVKYARMHADENGRMHSPVNASVFCWAQPQLTRTFYFSEWTGWRLRDKTRNRPQGELPLRHTPFGDRSRYTPFGLSAQRTIHQTIDTHTPPRDHTGQAGKPSVLHLTRPH